MAASAAFLIVLLSAFSSASQVEREEVSTVFDILGPDKPLRRGKAGISIWGRGGESAAGGFRAGVSELGVKWIPTDEPLRKRFFRIFPRAEITEVVDPWGRIPTGKGQGAAIRVLRKQMRDLHKTTGIELLILGKVHKRTRVTVTDSGEEVQKDPVTEVEITGLALPSGERLFTRSHRLQWPEAEGYDPSADLAEIGRGFGRRFRRRMAALFDKKTAADGTDEGR